MASDRSVLDPKRIVARGYDRMGTAFPEWNDQRAPEARRWFLGEILARLEDGSDVLELGCGPGTDAAALSADRRYVGVDLSEGQLAIARRRVPDATFVLGDFTSMAFRPASFDGVVGFYVFNHVPRDEVEPAFTRIFEWLCPGGRLMTSLLTTEAEDRVEEWLDVPMFFAGVEPQSYDRSLRNAGFELELSEIRTEMDVRYGRGDSRWVIARKPDDV
jgi:cyclopropane fatty-acyl-phospholipid synthase-like methyltransferase